MTRIMTRIMRDSNDASYPPDTLDFQLKFSNFIDFRTRHSSHEYLEYLKKNRTRIWRVRFRAYMRSVQHVKIEDAPSIAAARSEPLWHNVLLQTGRGLWVGMGSMATETTWRTWAEAGIRQVADITNDDVTFRSYSSVVNCYRTRKKMLRPDHYQTLIRHLRTTRVGQWLQGEDLLPSKVTWWLNTQAQHIWRHAPGDVTQVQGEWELYRPQSIDRYWRGKRVVHAVIRCGEGVNEHD